MNLHEDTVHLTELVSNQGAVGPRNVADVVQAQVVEDQHVPVTSFQDLVQMPRDIIINLK